MNDPIRVDARGLSCPQPVLLANQAIREGRPVEVLVDNTTAQENVTRAMQRKGWQVSVTQDPPGTWRLRLSKP